MNFYLNTSIPCSIVLPYLKRYLKMNKNGFEINPKINEYLNQVYDTSLSEILNNIDSYVKLNNTSKNLLQVYWDKNIVKSGNKVEDILNFLEYGNLDIAAPKIISKLMNNVLVFVDSVLGGF